MKNSVKSVVCTVLIVMMMNICACSGKAEEWAYIHEPETMVLSLSDNGKAIYKDVKYKYTKTDDHIELTGKDGEKLDMKYVMDGDKMILSERSTYQYDGEGSPDGIIGVWKQDNGWSFQFTEQNTFAEENIFFGHYLVNEDDHSIKLMYDDPIEDAILYYELDGNELVIDYPWPMVKAE